jgi:hypothetical protein
MKNNQSFGKIWRALLNTLVVPALLTCLAGVECFARTKNKNLKLVSTNANKCIQRGLELVKIDSYTIGCYSTSFHDTYNSTRVYPNGYRYEGGFLTRSDHFDDVRHGAGKLTLSDGSVFESNWEDDKPVGTGKLTTIDGSVHDVRWKSCGIAALENDLGSITVLSGASLREAGWFGCEGDGNGKAFFSDGTLYEGDWKDGKMHGNGKATFMSKNTYTGEWKDGEMNGYGKMTLPSGEKSYEGEWRDNKAPEYGKITVKDLVVKGKLRISRGVFPQIIGKGIVTRANRPATSCRDSGCLDIIDDMEATIEPDSHHD